MGRIVDQFVEPAASKVCDIWFTLWAAVDTAALLQLQGFNVLGSLRLKMHQWQSNHLSRKCVSLCVLLISRDRSEDMSWLAEQPRRLSACLASPSTSLSDQRRSATLALPLSFS
jgi:hypothetical protein